MTELTTSIRGSAGRSSWRRLPLLAGAGLLTGLLLTGGTLALWNDDGASPLGQIVAGDLDIDLVGQTRWHETSPDVVDQPAQRDPEVFLVRPGDTFTVTQEFATALQGDNMAAMLSVSWADDGEAALHESVTATYVVLGDDGEIAAADVGQAAQITRMATGNDGRSDTFTLQIKLAFADDGSDRFGPDADPVIADLGDIVIDLEQVRTGEGFN